MCRICKREQKESCYEGVHFKMKGSNQTVTLHGKTYTIAMAT